MPLPPPVEREHLHTRRYDFKGYRRIDGLWDIEGRITDVKTYSFPNDWRGEIAADEPLHDMSIRLTIDEDFLVHDIVVVTDKSPYRICSGAVVNIGCVKGMRIGPGWRRSLRERLGGIDGCTHHVEMLGAMATAAFQTLFFGIEKKTEKSPAGTRPAQIDSCYAWASDRDVVKRELPEFYTGE